MAMASSLRASTRFSCSRDTASSNQLLSIRRPVSSTISSTPTTIKLSMTNCSGLHEARANRKDKGAAASM
ncbi:hypothetical protein D3C72_2147740 [compost metagenome]